MDLNEFLTPKALFVGLSLTLALTLVVVASTSTAAFGLYNTQWDGSAELRALSGAENASYEVTESTAAYERLNASGAIAFVLAPDQPYTQTELARIRSFVERGGTLLVAADVSPVGNDLLAAVGADARIPGTLLRDDQHLYRSPAMPIATNVSQHPLTAGVQEVTLNYASPVAPNGATTLIATAPSAYVDTDRDGDLDESETPRSWPVLTVESVGQGRVITVGDPSIFINAMLEREGNRQFVRALAAQHRTVLLDTSHTAGIPVLVSLVTSLQETPAYQALAGLALLGLVAVATSRPIERLRRRRQPPKPDTEPREASLRAIVERQHPEWDDSRVERVVKGVTRDRSDERPDD